MPVRTYDALSPELERPVEDVTHEVDTAAPSPLTGARADSAQPVAGIAPPVPGLAVHRMTVGTADDAEERRADRVADQVLAALGGGAPSAHDHAGHDDCSDESVHRSADAPSGAIGEAGGELGAADSRTIASRAGQGSPLDPAAKQTLGGAMGADLSRIRIHTGPEAKALNERMSAAAFTTGSDIYFRDGHPDLSTGAGQHIMAHELAHAVGAGGSSVHRLGGGKGKGKVKTPKPEKEKKPGFFQRLFGKKDKKKDDGKTKPVDVEDTTPSSVVEATSSATVDATSSVTVNATTSEPLVEVDEEAELEKQRLAEEEQRKKQEAKRVQDAIDKRTKDYGAVSAMNLTALEKYTRETADWAKHSSMTDERPARLQQLIAFAGTTESAASPFTAGSLLAIGTNAATMTDTLTKLTTYGKAVQNDPFPIKQAASADVAVSVGADLTTLLAGFPRWVLASALTEANFELLRKYKLIDDVIAYYQGSPKPIFQAENGSDFRSYAIMRVNEKRDPRDYQNSELAPYVRNFHRFEARLLDRLIANAKDTSKTKPLTLILHSAVDHNGAFHRDAELFRVVGNNSNNTIMIEGGETLGAYKSQITPLAQAYGVRDKVDQVMFAGHGNAQSMQLGGTVEENSKGKLAEKNEGLNVAEGASTKAKTEELFNEVLANMDDVLPNLQDPKQPHRRLLFNACLTNSNVVNVKITGNEAEGRKQVRDFITANMSLATHLNDKAKKQGKDVEAKGANASITVVQLIDSSGGLDLVTAKDPKVTASKLEYTEHGKEPTGVLRAAVESYGNDAQATLQAMQARVEATKTSTDFDDLIVYAVYSDFIAKRKESSALQLNRLRILAEYAHGFSNLKSPTGASLAGLRGAFKLGWGAQILDTLLARAPEANQPQQGLMLSIARLSLDTTRSDLRNAVMTRLNDPFWTVKSADVDAGSGRYLDMTLLNQAGVVPELLNGPTTRGRLVLALAGHVGKVKAPECTTYLRNLRRPAVDAVPELAEVPEVPEVPVGKAPRAAVPEVPAVPGRPKVDKIEGQREERPPVPDLPKLDALPEVKLPGDEPATKKPTVPDPSETPLATSKKGEKKPEQPLSQSKQKPGEKPTDAKPTDTKVAPKTAVVAPGRPGRPKRDAVEGVPAVDPYFDESLGIEALLGGASTVRLVLKSL